MPIVRVVAIRMMQPDVNTETDPVILWVPPARIHDLIRICGGVDGTV